MNHLKKRAVLRALAAALAAVLLTVTVLAASELFFGEIFPKSYPEGVPTRPEQLRAMTVRTMQNADFPSAPNLPAKQLQTELERMVEFADTYGFNAIFFEASPQGDALYRSSVLPASAVWVGEEGAFTFFDPLAYLVNIGKDRGIAVYATVNPFAVSAKPAQNSPAVKNPAWVKNGMLDPAEVGVQKLAGQIVSELTENYDIAGVLFEGIDTEAFDGETYPKSLAAYLSHAHDAIKHKDTQRIGAVTGFDPARAKELLSEPLEKGDLGFLVPFVSADTNQTGDDYAAALAEWQVLCGESDFYPLHGVSDENAFAHQLDNCLYFDRQAQVAGVAVSNYGSLLTEKRIAAVSVAASFRQQLPAKTIDFSYPQSFAVTRPTEALTTSFDKYYITGTSDPGYPVLVDNREVPVTATGLWGTLVSVAPGQNTYQVSQNGDSKIVTINRPSASASGTGAVSTIDSIPKSSVYPAASEAVLSGEPLKLSCVAPAGGTVTATVGGLTKQLEPLSTGQNGVAMTYQATLDLSELAVAGQVKKLGVVSYALNYQGLNSSQDSAGEVFAVGEGAVAVAKMKAFTPVSASSADDGNYSTTLKKDCVAVISENPRGGSYKLTTGDFVPKASVDILEGTASAQNHVTAVAIEEVLKGEKITLTGTARPYFAGEWADGVLTVTLQNIDGFEKLNAAGLESKLCEAIESELPEDGSLRLTFRLAEGVELLGWDVQFENNDTVIYLRKKPTLLRETATPLAGFTILLDPGHGGSDPGALGIPGVTGPTEKMLNLANAYSLKARLEAFGAQVQLTQEDGTLTLNERIEMAEQIDADVFLSCHHNSLAENVDASTVSGVEVYYYNAQSKSFAEQIGALLSQDTGRKLRWADWSYYRVTMMIARPSVLVESGYICSPTEYEQIASAYGMYRYGNAVADAILDYFA